MISTVYMAFLLIVGFITFLLYGADKRRAQKGVWRISEKCLLGFSFLGGGMGGYAAMFLFRHKTKHWYFHVVHILAIAWQTGLLVFLAVRFGF